ncbi:MAG: excinuclease ABC subunit UvrC [Chlamydiota bacterium]
MPFNPKDLALYPVKSGVYLMKDSQACVLYVGKANNLRSRIRQYFRKSGDTRAMIPHLIEKVDAIDVIVVPTEREALLLENTLIKKHQPKYNALLKDDKRYVNIVLSKHAWPRLKIERHRKRTKDFRNTFGPYTNARAAREVLDMMNQIFALRECSDQELIRRTRPCLLHGIKRCIAPCMSSCKKEEYTRLVQSVRKLLQGRDTTILELLRQQMQDAAECLLFEKAASIRDMIGKIEHVLSKQHVNNREAKECDVWGISEKEGQAVLSKLLFREHQLVGLDHFHAPHMVADAPEFLETFLLEHYQEIEAPKEIFLPCMLPQQQALEELLMSGAQKNVSLFTPQRGEKKALVEMAEENATALLQRKEQTQEDLEQLLVQVQEALRLDHLPRRIVCFDSSSIQGAHQVAAAVVFIDGQKKAKEQRFFAIKDSVQDDYASLQEALTRYLARSLLPDLLIIDGGKGHLRVATAVLEKANIVGVDVVGISKEASLHTKGMTRETLHFPYRETMQLPKRSPVLFFLQKIRDEAHRVAIGFHRKKRAQNLTKSQLDRVPGIGPKKRTFLLKTYGSVKRIREELSKDPKTFAKKHPMITEKDVQALDRFFST